MSAEAAFRMTRTTVAVCALCALSGMMYLEMEDAEEAVEEETDTTIVGENDMHNLQQVPPTPAPVSQVVPAAIPQNCGYVDGGPRLPLCNGWERW